MRPRPPHFFQPHRSKSYFEMSFHTPASFPNVANTVGKWAITSGHNNGFRVSIHVGLEEGGKGEGLVQGLHVECTCGIKIRGHPKSSLSHLLHLTTTEGDCIRKRQKIASPGNTCCLAYCNSLAWNGAPSASPSLPYPQQTSSKRNGELKQTNKTTTIKHKHIE